MLVPFSPPHGGKPATILPAAKQLTQERETNQIPGSTVPASDSDFGARYGQTAIFEPGPGPDSNFRAWDGPRQ